MLLYNFKCIWQFEMLTKSFWVDIQQYSLLIKRQDTFVTSAHISLISPSLFQWKGGRNQWPKKRWSMYLAESLTSTNYNTIYWGLSICCITNYLKTCYFNSNSFFLFFVCDSVGSGLATLPPAAAFRWWFQLDHWLPAASFSMWSLTM